MDTPKNGFLYALIGTMVIFVLLIGITILSLSREDSPETNASEAVLQVEEASDDQPEDTPAESNVTPLSETTAMTSVTSEESPTTQMPQISTLTTSTLATSSSSLATQTTSTPLITVTIPALRCDKVAQENQTDRQYIIELYLHCLIRSSELGQVSDVEIASHLANIKQVGAQKIKANFINSNEYRCLQGQSTTPCAGGAPPIDPNKQGYCQTMTIDPTYPQQAERVKQLCANLR